MQKKIELYGFLKMCLYYAEVYDNASILRYLVWWFFKGGDQGTAVSYSLFLVSFLIEFRFILVKD